MVLLSHRFRLSELCEAFTGCLFGLGLAVCGLMRPADIVGVLNLKRASLFGLFLGVGYKVSHVGMSRAYRSILSRPRPLFGDRFEVNLNVGRGDDRVDMLMLFSAALFGMGLGVAGILPGPALVGLGASPSWPTLAFVLMMMLGLSSYAKAVIVGGYIQII